MLTMSNGPLPAKNVETKSGANSSQGVTIRTTSIVNFRWVDIESPKQGDLAKLSSDFGIAEPILMRCLDPEYLPKFQVLEKQVLFLIFRVMDPKPKNDSDSMTELTTKVALFIGPDFVLTIHRQKLIFIDEEFQVFQGAEKEKPQRKSDLVKCLISRMVKTFDKPLFDLEVRLETIEERIFAGKPQKRFLKDAYLLKRHSSIFKKVLKFSMDNITKLGSREEYPIVEFEEIRDQMERLAFYADDVFENITGILNLYVSLESQRTNEASYKTNEIMRALTVLSVFFLPLNFIAGVYGMNFENMPELKHPYGYISILALMALVALSLFLWIWRKGWLRSPEN